MDPTNGKGGGLDRRVSTRSSVRISADFGNGDFGASAITDGFRPSRPDNDDGSQQAAVSSHPSTNTLVADESLTSSPPSAPGTPLSGPKSHRPHESFALRHDGAMGPINESSVPTRSSSISTDSVPFIHTESPYQGPDGPSHPYQMYPQNVRIARTMSTTTSSTEARSESTYAGPRGPAHPYGMYTQTIAAESGDVPRVAPVPIFDGHGHGLPDQYQRRMGPEGEDIADIIGPDGHTEQLPPYTRYPDETYARKVRDAEDPDGPLPLPLTGGATVVRTNAAPMLAEAIPGAGGIGLATRNPEFESMDNLDSPRSRHSSRSFSSDASDHEINTAAARVSEKEKAPKAWQVWMRRRLWGIVPYWAICMTVGVLALMVAVLGSVIGTFMAKRYSHARKDPFPNPNSQPSITATYDATPIPTPSDLPPLPTGTFGIPPLTPNRVSNTCFNDTTLSQAWNCYFVMASMTLTVAKNPDNEGGAYTVALNCNHSSTLLNNVYAYGEQPPIISPVSMELVTDLLEPNRGPAWFRMLPYNKTVILPKHFLSPPGSPAPAGGKVRGLRQLSARVGEFKRKGVAKPGDKPWVCNWPQTWLEIFIYPQQNSSWFMGPPMPSPSLSSSTETPAATPRAETSSPTSPGTTSTQTEGLPGGYFGTNGPQGPQGHVHPNRQAPPPPPPKAPGPPPANRPANPPENTPANTPENTPATASATPTGPFGPIETGDSVTAGRPPVYPRVFKLEERRIAGAPLPDCTQFEIQEDGTAKPALDANGKPITIQIVENESPPQEPASQSGGDAQRRSNWQDQNSPLVSRESGPDVSQCGCMWFLT